MSTVNDVIDLSASASDPRSKKRKATDDSGADKAVKVKTEPGELFPKRDKKFYFTDGNIVLLVEGYLFRVYRHPLEKNSAVFSDMFSMPMCGEGEGTKDEDPIRLDGVPASEMRALLWAVCPSEPRDQSTVPAAEWLKALSASSRWEVDSLRTMALNALQTLKACPVERAAHAVRYNLPQFHSKALEDAVERPQPLLAAEIRQLSPEDVETITIVRELVRDQERESQDLASLTRRLHEIRAGRGSANSMTTPTVRNGVKIPGKAMELYRRIAQIRLDRDVARGIHGGSSDSAGRRSRQGWSWDSDV